MTALAIFARPAMPLRQRLLDSGFRSRLYRWWIGRTGAIEFRALPCVPWSGSIATANAMFQGRYEFAGHRAEAAGQPPWRLRPDDDAWLAGLHGFAWLDHFAAAGGEAAQAHARKLVRSWIDLCARIEPPIWSAGVLGERLVAWMTHAVFLSAGADPGFLAAFAASVGAQARHLGHLVGLLKPGGERLVAAQGLAFAAVSLGDEARLGRALGLVEAEAGRCIRADGGHLARNPSAALALARRLVALADLLRAGVRGVPDWLAGGIERLAAALRVCRHGDGGLALFHGGMEETPAAVDETLKRIAGKARVAAPASAGGFERLAAQRTVCIVDAGGPPARRDNAEPHWSRGGFEFSVGKHRLIVNCGSGAWRGSEWQAAGTHTAAHSTLVLADTDSLDDGGAVTNRSSDEACNQWLKVESQGYAERFGLVHDRSLYLDAAGIDLRGSDILRATAPGAIAPDCPFAIRFHLHPDVHVSQLNAADHLLLKLPAGQGWRFRSAGAALSIEESVYLGRQGEMRRSQQIVLSGRTRAEGAEVKWALWAIACCSAKPPGSTPAARRAAAGFW